MKAFPIPPNADPISQKAIKSFQQKLGHMVISPEEIQFIIDGIMEAQAPRDAERKRKEEERRHAREERRRLLKQSRTYAG